MYDGNALTLAWTDNFNSRWLQRCWAKLCKLPVMTGQIARSRFSTTLGCVNGPLLVAEPLTENGRIRPLQRRR